MDIHQQLSNVLSQLEKLAKKIDEAAVSRALTDKRLGDIEARLEAVEEATSYNLVTWIRRHWKIVVALSVPAPFMFSAFIIGAWQMKGDAVIEFLQEELQQATLNSQIFFQPPGLSFVRQPVEAGGTAYYVLVGKRTPVGASCTYLHTVPVFTDENGGSVTGDFPGRGRQWGEEMSRSELPLPVPEGLKPGRITVVLQMRYACGSETITHETYPVAFELLPTS